MHPRGLWRSVALWLAVAASGCTESPSAPTASGPVEAGGADAAVAHAPSVHLISSKDHRHVLKMDIGDAIEIPQDSEYNYQSELKDPTIFRADSPTHFTAIKSGPTPLMVNAMPICHEADAAACGRSQERWVVQLIVR